ncbi:MAG: TIGR02452 family protein [Alphaproteobacteria bacterium]|nr:TIGR02452 family protein [Alphaproteobacteria bacterium]
MSLESVAQQTLDICEAGVYVAPSGATVDISAEQRAAEAGSRLYRPRPLSQLLDGVSPGEGPPPTIEVTDEKTQEAGRRICLDEGVEDPVLLNFASARNVGGGFLGGAKAQEEDVCRCSGLYPTLLPHWEYYDANRRQRSALYTHHLIYSPKVPFFRVDAPRRPTHQVGDPGLLERPFFASVITAPAPNAGVVLQQRQGTEADIDEALRRRAGYVLAVAQDQGHRTLILGAWGCGVFGNDPALVADAFGRWLEAPRFAGAFDRVVFAVLTANRRDVGNLEAFELRFP